MKNYVAILFTFFENVFAICKFFAAWCLDVRFWDPLNYICLKFNPQYSSLLLREKMCWFSSYFQQEEGRNFCSIFTKFQKLCLHKTFNIGSITKINSVNFTFLCWCEMDNTLVLRKKKFISQLFKYIKLCLCFFLFKKTFSPQKMFISCFCLCHGAYLNSTSNGFTYLLIIFLGNDWLEFFLSKWRCFRSTP